MTTKIPQLILGIIIGFFLGFIVAKRFFVSNTSPIINPITVPTQQGTKPTANTPTQNIHESSNTGSIPPKAFVVLKYILANGHAMDGYVGGRVFTNRERVVPTQDAKGNNIDYHEWDVNPHLEGVNRGTERILTGSDGRSWYTNDHYQTFAEMK